MDKDIFEQLYRQHYAAALLYAQGLCRSRPLAEDMVQEAFCRAWLALPDGVVSFRSWLFRVLRNLIIDHLRRQKHLSDEDVPETADAATPESVLLQREDAAALYRAMERLGAGDREVLTLYCFAHLSGAELAAALDALPEYMRLTSAVSFHKVLTVDELADIMARHPDVDFLSANVWVDGAYNYDSLHCSLQHMMLAYGDDLEEDYPGMQLQEYKNLTGEDITQHFRAMVQYLADHPEVAKAGPDEPYRYKEMLLNLEEDGLEVLGLWVQGTPDQITALLDEELVRSVRNYDARIQLWT